MKQFRNYNNYYKKIRMKILKELQIESIIDIGSYFKNVRGEQIVIVLKKANPNLRLWQIGNECPNYLKAHKIKSNDTEAVMRDKKNVLAASVKRHLTQAQLLIDKVEKGIFP
jgi:hypothetical protein